MAAPFDFPNSTGTTKLPPSRRRRRFAPARSISACLCKTQPSGEAATDIHVVVRIAPIDRPDEALTEVATTAAATNKLFHSALFELPAPGRWQVNIAVGGPSGPAEAHFELEAGEPLPHWLAIWPWIGWPAIAIALFGIHQYLVYRRFDNAIRTVV